MVSIPQNSDFAYWFEDAKDAEPFTTAQTPSLMTIPGHQAKISMGTSESSKRIMLAATPQIHNERLSMEIVFEYSISKDNPDSEVPYRSSRRLNSGLAMDFGSSIVCAMCLGDEIEAIPDRDVLVVIKPPSIPVTQDRGPLPSKK